MIKNLRLTLPVQIDAHLTRQTDIDSIAQASALSKISKFSRDPKTGVLRSSTIKVSEMQISNEQDAERYRKSRY